MNKKNCWLLGRWDKIYTAAHKQRFVTHDISFQ